MLLAISSAPPKRANTSSGCVQPGKWAIETSAGSENDTIVPVTLGERLYSLIRAPKRFVRIAGAGHNDLGAQAVAAATQFIADQ